MNDATTQVAALSAYLQALAAVQARGDTYVSREIRTTIERIEQLKKGMERNEMGRNDGQTTQSDTK